MGLQFKASPTGSGNLVFEGDVLNGYATPGGKNIALKFYGNDRGYACAAFGQTGSTGLPLDFAAAQALRTELAALLEQHSGKNDVFTAASAQKHYTLLREFAAAPLVLAIHGSDSRFGDCWHHGDAAALKKVVDEFDAVLKAIADFIQRGPSFFGKG